MYRNCFWHSEQVLYGTCSPHFLQKEELLTKIYLHSAQWSWYRKYHPKNKKHWKFKCEKYAGFKAQMEKNRLIGDQFPHKNHVPIVKNPPFSPGCMASQWFLEPPTNVGDSKINSIKFLNYKISTFYCWLYFPTSIVHILDYLLTPERFARQQLV